MLRRLILYAVIVCAHAWAGNCVKQAKLFVSSGFVLHGCIVISFLPPNPKTAHSHACALIGTVGEQLQIACGSNGVNSKGTGIPPTIEFLSLSPL